MELVLIHNFQVYIEALIWISIISMGNTAYIQRDYPNSRESLENSNYFESKKTNTLKRQAADLQNLDVESTEELQTNFDDPPHYDFEYKIHGGGNFLGHSESRRDGQTQGNYHTLLPDGRMQIVSYYADETGYHPTITYELISDNKSLLVIKHNDLVGDPRKNQVRYGDKIKDDNQLRKRHIARIIKRTRRRYN